MPATPHPFTLSMLLALGAASLAVAACGPESDAPGADTGSASSDPDDTGSATTSGAALPDACSIDASPFLQPECLDALRLACNAHAAENDCAAAAPFAFDDGGFVIGCAWAKVVTFSDATQCTVESVAGRCEARIDSECGDYCAGDFMLSDVAAIPAQLEIVQLCGGPLGAWSATDAEPGTVVSTCAPNVEPPSDPLCDCATTACDAQ